MKKRLVWAIFIVAMIVSGLCMIVGAAETAPRVEVYGYNLIFGDQVSMEYAVKAEGFSGISESDVGVLIWKEDTAIHTVETADADLTSFKTATVGGVECYILKYTNLSAKEMNDKVYAKPYVKADGKTVYGEEVEYSVCTYAQRKLGLVEGAEGTKDEKLRDMIREMLDYGANAQKYFGYKTDKLATDLLKNRISVIYKEMTSVDADGKETGVPNPNPATFALASGNYKLQAPGKKGYTFKYWVDTDRAWKPVTEIDTSTTKTYNLAAVWEMNMYSITYKGTMGVYNDNAERYTVEELVQLRPLEKYDYEFIGWRLTNSDGQSNAVEEIPVGSTGNIVLTAEWEQKTAFKGFDYIVDDNYNLPNGQKFCILLGLDATNDAKKLEIPDVFNHIQVGALKYCSQLEELTLPFLGTDYTGTAGSYLGYVFGAYTARGQNDVIPESLKKVTVNGSGRIGENAFRDCTSLVEIVVSGTSCDIGENAYLGCTSLKSLTTPVYYNDAMKYGTSYYPKYQTDFYYGIPGSVEGKNRKDPTLTSKMSPDIPVDSFETLHINGGQIGCYAFTNNCGIKHLIIEGVDVIRNHAFQIMQYMETLELREGLKQIQNSAFYRCENLTELIIPNSVTSLCGVDYYEVNDYEGSIAGYPSVANTFHLCSRLSKIVIGDGVVVIPAQCFDRWNPKTPLELTLGKNVRVIGHWAFMAEINGGFSCNISKIINNSDQEEMLIYWQGDDDGSEFLNVLKNCNKPPKKIYLGSYEDGKTNGAAIQPITETNYITEEQLRSFEGVFELVLGSNVNPYENGTALEGFDYWHGKNPAYYWIYSQYDEIVLWEKPQTSGE